MAKNKQLHLIANIGRQVQGGVRDAVTGLSSVALLPFRDLKRIRERNKVTSFKDLVVSVLLWPFKMLLSLFSILLRTLMSPMELIVGLFQRNSRDVLWSLPWIATLSFLSLFGYFGIFNAEARLNQLRKAAIGSFNAGDLVVAEKDYRRLILASSVPKEADLLQWFVTLQATDQKEKATEVISQLAPAPDTNPGYAPAHQLVCAAIVEEMERPSDPVTLKALKWHLDCSGDARSPLIERCWAEYYLGINEPQNGLRHMMKAAELNPEYFVMVADINRGLGFRDAQMSALQAAQEHYKFLIEKKPLIHKHRIMYARILKDLGRIDSAEQQLLNGVGLKNDPEIRSACCGFYLMLFNEEEDATPERKFELLKKSLRYDPNHSPTYQALIRFYRDMDLNAPQKKSTIEYLRKAIAVDKPAALSFFALSNILWTENKLEESQVLMEKAFSLDSSFAVIANNLAWLLAHSSTPDLERAAAMARQAVIAEPYNGRIRDTLATILMKQKKFDEALAEFQLALQRPMLNTSTKQKIHRKMAEAYRTIGNPDLAAQHDKRATMN
jgi:tetratricopeptide (TPR) repeat protein